jgi:hypothetical protein
VSELARRVARRLGAGTLERVGRLGLDNARANAPWGRSVLELAEELDRADDRAVVVGAGPSLRRRRSLERLRAAREAGYRGALVACDGALGACLRAGLVPDVVVSVDPHPERILRWFGDPGLSARPADDYFRRQEMDDEQARDEVAANRELLRLVEAHGKEMRLAVASAVSPRVVRRAAEAGLRLFWWNPFVDDPEAPGSLTAELFRLNGLPCLNGGGNVGTAAWVLAHAVLGARRVGLVGIDFGYAPGTPPERTQYHPELVAFARQHGVAVADLFVAVANPVTGETWFCDPAYWWFREVFLEMVPDAPARTYNCTEGGVLYGPGVLAATVEEFCGAAGAGPAGPGGPARG